MLKHKNKKTLRYSIVFLLFVSSLSSFAQFIIEPFIQDVGLSIDKPQIIIRWESDTEVGNYSLSLHPSSLKKDVKAIAPKCKKLNLLKKSFLYQVKLEDLSPNTEYSYSIFQGKDQVFESHFKTRPTENKFRFAYVACNGEGTEAQRNILTQIKQLNPDFIVHGGDFVYPKGTRREFIKNGFPYYKNLISQVPMFLNHGNHDIGDQEGLSKTCDNAAALIYFSSPDNGPIVEKKFPGEKEELEKFYKHAPKEKIKKCSFYSVTYGKTLMIFLDGNIWVNQSDKKILEWLNKTLSESKVLVKIAFIHQPPFSTGMELCATQLGKTPQGIFFQNDINRARVFTEILQEHDVKLCVSAHLHVYERSKPLTYGTKDNKIVVDDKGITYITSGAGGAHLHTKNFVEAIKKMPNLMQQVQKMNTTPELFVKFALSKVSKYSFHAKHDFDQYSFTFVEVDGQNINIQQINEQGKVIDQLTIQK